jgi:hypothetical protein
MAGVTPIDDVPDAPTIGAATNVGTSRAYNNGSATVAYTAAPTGGTATTFTATSTPGSFTAINEASWLNPDGVYQVVYTVQVGATTYKNKTQHVLFLCNLCNCKDALIVRLLNACDTKAVIKLKEQVDQMEIFMYGIKSAFSCGDFDTLETLLDAATKYCQTISDCADCGCSGC